MELKTLTREFTERYGGSDSNIRIFFSPGRVNLIGEHTDYNGGHVFPCALTYGTYMAIRKNNNNVIRFASLNFEQGAQVSIDALDKRDGGDSWINYPLGVIHEFHAKGHAVPGFDCVISGNIPNGAGLSSSASLEVVTAVAIDDMLDTKIDRVELVKMSQSAENNFVGVNCGIMDQFAVGMGAKQKAICLDCTSLEYELVPFIIDGYKIVIANSNKRRGLADSKYNERRSECESAVEQISKVKKISTLGELSLEQFEKLSSHIDSDIVMRRARHAVAENERTLKAVSALKAGDIKAFGQLMNESHDSLRDDYEVSGVELDTLVNEARKIEGVIGSRMTGAGFGGCTVSIVREDLIDSFIDTVGTNYNLATGLRAAFYISDIGDGASRLV